MTATAPSATRARARIGRRIWAEHSPALLALAAYALAFAQRPGQLVADTKIDLHTDPVGFLGDAAAAWAPSGGLGQVQAGQYAGYLWPMGPFHAVGDLLGLAPWVVHRLWLGTLLALAAWGTVRLYDALCGDRPRGVGQLVAGAAMVANPYVVVFANRTSVTLLAYALLPWLALCAHRGLRDPRGWRWPAAIALLTTSLGAGVNGAVAAWVLLGPALLIVYEVAVVGVAARAAAALLARALPLAALASAWWLAPVLVQLRYGVDFLAFTEPAGAIWTPTSMSESLRLMGFWVAYLGVGYGPQLSPAFDSAPTLLFSPAVVVATFAAPALAIAGFAWTRRWRYGPFFAALALVALAIMFTGFPDGAPLRRALHFAYDRVEPVQFLRTTYKAGPLLALALACLLGGAAAVLFERLRGRLARAAVAAGAAGLLAVAAWPLVSGRAVDGQIAFERIPVGWERAADDLDRNLPRGTRALVLPGQVFPFYRWGGTQDAVLPALTDRPVAVRGVVPYADLRAVDLLWTTDALVQQRRALPGQLAPLIRLMGAGAVVSATDDDRARSGAVGPAAAAAALRRGAGLGRPDRRFGAVRRHAVADPSGLVRVRPRAAPVVVDGAAGALAALAALGALPDDRIVLYAADLSPRELRATLRAGAELVVSDSNRRRTVLASQPRQGEGATLDADHPLPDGAALLDPFERGDAARTVAVYDGARSLEAPFSPAFVQLPEHRPYAAFDGDRSTWWAADRNLDREDHWLELDLGRPVDVPAIELLPQREARTELRAVEIAGRRHPVRPGWNRIELGLDDVRRLRIAVAAVDGAPAGLTGGAGAIAELRIPGVRVRERLRPPLVGARALAASGGRRTAVTFAFERTTGTAPRRRSAAADPDATSVPERANPTRALVAAAGDGELAIARRVRLPGGRRWRADGWLSVAPGRRRAALARLRGPAGQIAGRCGALGARVLVTPRRPGAGAAVLRLRPVGPNAALAAGAPLRARPCGRRPRLPAGRATVTTPRGPLRADVLRLRAPARLPAPPPVPPGRVLDPGEDGRGDREGVRLALDRPAWLVLAESFNRGWRARCDGRDLGAPRPVDGFANGWRVPRDCRAVGFSFAPQRTMDAGFAISAVVCAALLALLAVAVRRRRRGRVAATAGDERWPPPGGPLPAGTPRLSPRPALALGALAGALGAFVFALRAGVAIGPAVALVLWRGVGAGALALAAGALAGLALPAIYLLFPPTDLGGYNADYANELVGAHWVAVAVWVLLALAVSRAIARRRAGARAGAGAASAGP